MFNEFQFNESVFNQTTLVVDPKESLNYYIKYNGYYIHDNSTTFSMIEYLNPKEIFFEENQHWLNFWDYYNFQETQKQIKISWTIKTNSRSELLEEIIKMKWYILTPNQDLIIKESWEIKKIKWFNKISFSENHYNINWMSFEIEFLSFEYLQDFNVLSKFWTQATLSFIFSNGGTAQSKINLVINIKSSISEIVTIINWQILTITWTFISWDVLFIDWYSQRITHNWELVDFDWEIQVLDPWYNGVKILQSWDIDYLISTYPSYK